MAKRKGERPGSPGPKPGITRTRDPLEQFHDHLPAEAEATVEDVFGMFLRLARAGAVGPRIERLRRHSELVALADELDGDLQMMEGKADALFHARLAQAEAHAGRLDDRPRIARDEARQRGTRTKRERWPGLQDWIEKQVARMPDEKVQELWDRRPDWIADPRDREPIGRDAFQKRVTRARKEVGISRK